MKIRHGAQKLSEAVFCRCPESAILSGNRMQKIAALDFCTPELSIFGILYNFLKTKIEI
ncbi:hypothetical protein QUF75_15320 [Desulfococcaceae bacterium HSG7]|nr:hypothetical protein [Desulfococcaceae bacterium HSG7]